MLKETLTRYISNINREFEKKVAKTNLKLGESKLITTRRGIGMRLTWPVELIQPDAISDAGSNDIR